MPDKSSFFKTVELSGGCLCGAVRYEISGPVKNVSCCHCSQCRKQTGLYYATVETPMSAISIQGTDNLSFYRASDFATRKFCKHCGSALFWQQDGIDRIDVLAGSIDGATGLITRKHINCADQADFYTLPADGVKFPHHGDAE